MSQATGPISQLVIIDSRVNDWQSLVSDVGTDTAVLILNSSSDGLTQISDYLTTLSANAGALNPASLQSIHIISHGSAGSLSLGSATLNSGNLGNYASQLAVIGNALKAKGDVLLYGCNVAQGEAGLAFINQFAALTGADVAASDDLTGAALQGGDWDLEARMGRIESASLSDAAYGDVLAANVAGIITTDFGSSDYGSSVTVQADGKILVAGKSWIGGDYDFALVRYNSNGSLDTGFGYGGKVTTVIGSSDDTGRSVTIQADGKILVSGYSYNGSNYDFALVRYNNGSLDTSFGYDGIVTAYAGVAYDYLNSVKVQADGKILVAGYSRIGGDYDFILIRYNSNGSLDASFDYNGIVTTDFNLRDDTAYSVTVQPDGKILVAGAAFRVDGGNDFALVRYNSNGSLDTSFSYDGKVTTDLSYYGDVASAVIVQADGKILVAGDYDLDNGDNTRFALVRYNSNGSLDTSFSYDGKVTTDFGYDDEAHSVTLQADGKILVAGDSYIGGDKDFALVRYNTNGSLDTSFSYDGRVTTHFGYGDDEGVSVTVQTDGKILVAGESYNGSNYDIGLVRYNPDGSLDATFNGITNTPPPTADSIFIDQGDGAKEVGIIRVMADFSKVAYALQPWEQDTAYNDVSDNADTAFNDVENQGWQPLNLSILGLISGQFSLTNHAGIDEIETYLVDNQMAGGYYTNNNAAAFVAHSADAIVIAFRGTNDNGDDNPLDSGNNIYPDKDQWSYMREHYDLFEPLITAIDNYVADSSNGISKVYVTGHSLGGAMAIQYMGTHSGSKYSAVTFAAPGFVDVGQGGAYYPDLDRVTHIEINGDATPDVGAHGGRTIHFEGDNDAWYSTGADHSMDYYRQITKSVDSTGWTTILAQDGDQEVFLGASINETSNGTLYYIVDGLQSGTNTPVDDAGNNTLTDPLGNDYDIYYGGRGNDELTGGSDNELLFGGAGDDAIDGGTGTDTAMFSTGRSFYSFTKTGAAIYSITDMSGAEGIDSLANVERLQFSDVGVALDLTGNSGMVAKILGGVFGSTAVSNEEYVGIGLSLLDGGMSYQDLMALAIGVTGQTTPLDIVRLLWTNVVGSAPTNEQAQPFVDMLNNGWSVGQLGVLAADTDLNQGNINLIGLAQTGLEYIMA